MNDRAASLPVLALVACLTSATLGSFAQDSEPPSSLSRLEHLVGTWKGTARRPANRIRGWTERHVWSWKFEKGKPVALVLRAEQNKFLTEGRLTTDPAKKTYRLVGTDATSKPVAFSGSLDSTGKTLVLDREGGDVSRGRERLTIRPAAGGIRYVMLLDRKDAGAPQYKNEIEVGLTKEGENFAAGSSSGDAPKCIVTGGAAGLSVSYQGVSYPICCTGCRDEFNDDPVKYVEKAKKRAAGPAPAKSRPKPSTGDDAGFDGLLDAPKTGANQEAAPPAKKGARP